jgi:hypothetical protein
MASLAATAFHEAGHIVAAYWYGIPIHGKGASIRPRYGSYGRIFTVRTFRLNVGTFRSRPKAQRQAEKSAIVGMAGLAAQRIFNPYTVSESDGMFDVPETWRTLSYLSWNPEETDLRLKLAEAQAKEFVNIPTAWKLIEAVAEALLERKELSKREILEVIKNVRKQQRPT